MVLTNNEKIREVLSKLYDLPDRFEPMTPHRLARALGYVTTYEIQCFCEIIKQLAKDGVFIDTGKRQNGGYNGRKEIVYLLNTKDNRLNHDLVAINTDILTRKVVKRVLNGDYDTKLDSLI